MFLDLQNTTLDLSHPCCREYFKWLADLGKGRDSSGISNLRDEHLSDLLDVAKSKNDEDTATIFRFGLRLLRLAGKQNDSFAARFKSELASLYSHQSERSEADRKTVLECWAARYSSVGMIEAGAGNDKSRTQQDIKQGGEVSLVCETDGGWLVSGLTHSGKFDKNGNIVTNNDDAFLVLEGDDKSFLAAVADGTGDSQDGARAARVALEKLAANWKQSGHIGTAVAAAAVAVQEDNRAAHLDGACTLVALASSAKHAQVVQLGDARYLLLTSTGDEKRALVDKSARLVLGGEPLGDIITSSGHLVRESDPSTEHHAIEAAQLARFVLTSDGALFLDRQEDDFGQIREILVKNSNPQDAARALVDRALEAFRFGVAKPDNITVIVGYSSIPSSRSPSGN